MDVHAKVQATYNPKPKYSLVVAVYNTEQYLPACLDSLVSQTYKDFEIIIINDGSTDNSLTICNEYKNKHPEIPIRIVSQQNKGALFAKLIGFEIALGDFIWSIDSDDTIREDSLELINVVQEKTNADLIFFEYSLNHNYSANYKTLLFANQTRFTSENKIDLLHLYCKGRLYSIATKVIRKSCLPSTQKYSLFKGLSNGDDNLISLDMICNSQNSVYIPDTPYYYRHNHNSTTSNYQKGVLKEQGEVTRYQKPIIEKWSEEYSDKSLENEFKISTLGILYYVSRRQLSYRNKKQVLSELREIKEYSYLAEAIPQLRFDQKIYFSLVKHKMGFLTYCFSKFMLILSKIKNSK